MINSTRIKLFKQDYTPWLDVTAEAWPTYRRETRAVGGDWSASFSIAEGKGATRLLLEDIYASALGARMEESYGGQVTFAGVVTAIGITRSGGLTQTKSLEQVYNKIRVRYQTDSAAAEALTAEVTNNQSVTLYGARSLIYRAPGYIPLATATALRDSLLAISALPEDVPDSLTFERGSVTTVRLDVTGYAQLMNARLLNDASTSTSTVSAEIAAAVLGDQYVTLGRVDTNTLGVSEEVEYQGAWARVAELTELGGVGGVGQPIRYRVGCFGGSVFSYEAISEETVYAVRLRDGTLRGIGQRSEFPAALARPGVYISLDDVDVGRLGESRMYADSLVFNASGVGFRTSGAKNRDTLAMKMALARIPSPLRR